MPGKLQLAAAARQVDRSIPKRVTEYIIAHASFEAGARQEDVIRLEARVGVIGSVQKSINQLETIKRGANGSLSADVLNTKIEEALTDLEKLLENLNNPEDKELVNAGLFEIAGKIPFTPKPPKETIYTEDAIFQFRRRRDQLMRFFFERV